MTSGASHGESAVAYCGQVTRLLRRSCPRRCDPFTFALGRALPGAADALAV